MSIAIVVIASVIFVILLVLAFWLIFFKSGPVGVTGPNGPTGPAAVPDSQNDLAINSIFQLSNSRICTIANYVFLSPGINYNQTNLVLDQINDPSKNYVLSLTYDPRLPSTMILGVTNTTSQPLYLNMVGFTDLNGLPFSTYQPTLPNGGCNSTVDTTQFSPYVLNPQSSTLLTIVGNQINF